MRPFIRNCWYAVGWSEELSSQPLGRAVLDQRIVLWRAEDGAPVAMRDRCPHRLAPLSRGQCAGDVLICGYHGLRFNAQGVCVHNPFSDRISPNLKVSTLPVVERHAMLWLWPGDAALADPAQIPEFGFNVDGPDNRVVRGVTPVAADYEILNDNLLNLAHIEFLHTGTFAGAGVIFQGQYSAKRDGDVVDSNWWMPNIDPPPFARAMFPAGMKVDHWLEMRWHAPSIMHLRVGVTAAGASRESGMCYDQAHIVTPTGPGRSHYWWSFARRHDVDSNEFDAFLKAQLSEAFNLEDKPMLEAVDANLDGVALWDERPVSLPIDVGAALAHKVIAERIRNEEPLAGGGSAAASLSASGARTAG
jgi:phenylpropionate dioxygenase-like ring-hydroxylating dioxygenase large terminal subunit